MLLFIDVEALSIKRLINNFQQYGFDIVSENQSSIGKNIAAIEKYCPNLIIIDLNNENKEKVFILGRYLLKKDLSPYIYISNLFDKLTLNQVNETRPHGFIPKPVTHDALIFIIHLIINNYRHRKIDVVRNEIYIENEEPLILKKVIEYIDDNIFQRMEINNLVELTQWKSQYLQRLFFKYLQINPHDYIIKKKMQIAMALVAETKLPLMEISNKIGFLSYSNFCINFKKTTGKTPTDYRKTQKIIQSIYSDDLIS